jgi:hypothetical protein
MDDRGKIRNRNHALQIKDFSRLRYGKITPTDIDFYIDFGDKVSVLGELKHGNSELPVGQRLALERLVDDIQRGGKRAYGLISRHWTSGDIDVGLTEVSEFRYKYEWKIPEREWLTVDFIDEIAGRLGYQIDRKLTHRNPCDNIITVG